MQEEKKIKPPTDFNEQLIALLNDHIRYHTIQIFKKNTDYSPEGTGVLYQIDDLQILLTAAHVLEAIVNGGSLYFRFSESKFIEIGGHLVQVYNDSASEDIAALILPPPLSKELLKIGLRFLPIQKSGRLENLDSTQYFIYGFPTINIKHANGIMETGGTFFLCHLTNDKPYDYYDLDKDKIYCVSYNYPRDFFTEEKKETIEPYGMSGSGLWFISISESEDKYSYDYSLLGIMTKFTFRGKYQVLIGNRMSVITEELERKKVIGKQ